MSVASTLAEKIVARACGREKESGMGCYNSIVVNAPVDKVWAAMRDFHDMSWASGVIEKVDPVGDRQRESVDISATADPEGVLSARGQPGRHSYFRRQGHLDDLRRRGR